MSCPTKIVSPENWYFLNGLDPQPPSGKFLSDPHHGVYDDTLAIASYIATFKCLLFYFQLRLKKKKRFHVPITVIKTRSAFFLNRKRFIYISFVPTVFITFFFININVCVQVSRVFGSPCCSVCTHHKLRVTIQ